MKENVPITEPIEMIDPNWMQKTGGYARDMTLRDYFAGLAMQTLAHKYSHAGDVSRNAYILADAMLKARDAK